jgi:peptidoglycan hydrolase-like protein with peptidoglycan-binding domain
MERETRRPTAARRLVPWVVLLLAAAAPPAVADPPADAPATASDGTGTLSREQIRMVQRTLADKGYAVQTTSTWDDSTRAALASFQRSQQLPATGSIDTATAQALGVDPASVMPVRAMEVPTGPYDRFDPSDMDVNCGVNNTVDCRYGGG